MPARSRLAVRARVAPPVGDPFEPPLRPRLPLRIEMTLDRSPVRSRDPAGVRREALVAKRAPILAVRHDQVRTRQRTRGKQEGEADSGGDLEERTTFRV